MDEFFAKKEKEKKGKRKRQISIDFYFVSPINFLDREHR